MLQEPHRSIGRADKVLVGLMLLVGSVVTGMERVQEVESGLEIDAVRMLGRRDVHHLITTLHRLTGYAQEANLHQVTRA